MNGGKSRDRIAEWAGSLRIPGLPDEYEAKNLPRIHGIPVPEGIRLLPGDGGGDGGKAEELCTAAVKVCSPHILHKTEVGGVRLGVSYGELPGVVAAFREKFPDEPILVEKAAAFSGPEFIVGGIKDPAFGPAIVVGAGGILTELYKDVSSRLCPCCREDALRMLDELTLSPIFRGYRNLSYDGEALADLVTAVSILLAEGETILSQMDLNPVVFTERGWLVLDAKIILL